MNELSETLKRWPADIENPNPKKRVVAELTAAECDTLVAVHVMGWELAEHQPMWATLNEERSAVYYNRRVDAWNPTADRNDCAEAVKSVYFKIGKAKLIEKLKWVAFNHDTSLVHHINAFGVWLLDPSDVCLALLQALAESEGIK